MTAFRYVPLDTLAIAVLATLCLAVVATAPAIRRRDAAAAMLRAARVLLAGALLAVLAVTMLNGASGTGVNLLPGAGIRGALGNANSDLGLLNLLGNVAMFVPVGFLLPLATRLGLRGAIGACAASSAMVEALQLLVGRSFDVDDVLLNATGGALGAAAGVAAAAWLRRRVLHSLGTTAPEVTSPR